VRTTGLCHRPTPISRPTPTGRPTLIGHPKLISRPRLISTATLVLAVLTATACSAPTPAAAPPASGSPAASTAAAADPANICGAAVDVAKVIGAGPDIGEEPVTPEQLTSGFAEYRAGLEPPLAALEQNPPPGEKDDISTLARQARFAIANKDPNAVQTDEFQDAAGRLTAYIVRDCKYPVVRVSATEYAYAGIPPTAPPGTTIFSLVNEGTVPHDLSIYRIDEDAKQPFKDIVALPEVQRNAIVEDVGSVSTNPGSDDTVFVKLTPGRYGIACFEPQGTTVDKEGTGPPHAAAGEVAEFTVS
jgi:hypothetical protein